MKIKRVIDHQISILLLKDHLTPKTGGMADKIQPSDLSTKQIVVVFEYTNVSIFVCLHLAGTKA